MIAISPPIPNQARSDIAAIVHRVDTTDSSFWRQHNGVLPTESVSPFWTREREFVQLKESTRKAKGFGKGWDGYDAPAPNDTSVARTLAVLSKVRDSKLTPYSVLPSADGGIGISFRGNGNKRAVLELLNDGTSSYMLYGKGLPTESSEFDLSGELTKILGLLEEYL